MTIFVDVDDTLVLFGNPPKPYGVIHGKPFTLNAALIERVLKAKAEIVVWSGGGTEYAQVVGHIAFPTTGFTPMTKGSSAAFDRMREGDIIVDDQPEFLITLRDIGIKVYTPFEEWG